MKKLALLLGALLLIPWYQAWSQCGPCSYKVGNMVVNGDFELGNIGFSSDYLISTNLYPEGNYAVGPSAKTYHNNFYGFGHQGSGNFMVVNGAPVPGTKVWCQTIVVVPNTNYNFSTWISSVHPSNPALLQFSINDIQIGDIFQAPGSTNNWQEFFVNWNSGNSTTATICIENMSTIRAGNDFGIDEISFAPCLPYNINNRPTAGLDTLICSGESIALGYGNPTGFDITWGPDSLFSDPNQLFQEIEFLNEDSVIKTFTLTLNTDSAGLGCLAQESITVQVLPLPKLQLIPDTAICEGPVRISPVASPGSFFKWSDGSENEYIDIYETGAFDVEVELFGCSIKDSFEVRVDTLPLFELGGPYRICEGDSIEVQAPASGIWLDNTQSGSRYLSSTQELVYQRQNGVCTCTDTVSVTMDTLPQFELGPDTQLCVAPPFMLAIPASPWQGPNAIQEIEIFQDSTLSITTTNGACSFQDQRSIQFAQVSPPVLPDTAICESDSLLVSVPTLANEQILWSDGSTANPRYLFPGQSLSLSKSNDYCSEQESLSISSIALPTPQLPDSLLSCEDELIEVNYPLAAGQQLLWSDGLSTNPRTFNESGDYSLNISNQGCSINENISILYDALPIATLEAAEAICNEAPVLLEIVSNQDYLYTWNTQASSSEIWVQEAGNYWVDIVNGLCSIRETAIVQKFSNPLPSLPDTVVSCFGEAVLVQSPNAVFWPDGSLSTSFSSTASGWITYYLNAGTCVYLDSVFVHLDSLPRPEFYPLPICKDDQRSVPFVQDFSAYDFIWKDGNSNQWRTFNDTTARVFYYFGNGLCRSEGFVNISSIPKPNILLPEQIRICEGESTILEAQVPPGYQFQWFDGDRTQQTRNFSESGVISIMAWNQACNATDTCEIIVESKPNIPETPSDTACLGTEMLYQLPSWPGYQSSWLDGSTSDTIINASSTLAYKVFNEVCEAQGSFRFKAINPPNITLNDSSALCAGDSVLVSAEIQAAENYTLDFDGEPNPFKYFNSGGYKYLQVIGKHCSKRDSIYIQVDDIVFDDGKISDSLCEGDSYVFSWELNPNYQYQWSDGYSVNGTRTFSEQTVTTLNVNYGACSRSKDFDIQYFKKPVILLDSAYTFCEGTSVQINPLIENASEWYWLGLNSQQREFFLPQNLTLEAQNGPCISRASTEILERAYPPERAPIDSTLCENDTLVYRIISEYSVTWENGDSILRSTEPGYYQYTLHNGQCSSTSQLIHRVQKRPSLNYPDTLICSNESILIQTQIPGYQHYLNGQPFNSMPLIEEGNYEVSVDNGICTASTRFDLEIEAMPKLELGVNQRFCEGESVLVIPVYDNNYRFTWQDAYPNVNREFTKAGWYIAELSGEVCIQRDTLGVLEIKAPEFELQQEQSLCQGDSAFLAAVNVKHAQSWSWTDNPNLQRNSRYISEANTYTLIAYNEGCAFAQSITVPRIKSPISGLEKDFSACEGDSISYPLPVANGINYFLNGEAVNDPVLYFFESQQSILSAETEGCQFSDTLNIDFLEYPEIVVPAELSICFGDSVQIEPQLSSNSAARWMDSDSELSRWLKFAGVYQMVAVNGLCSSFASTTLVVDSLPLFDHPELNICEDQFGNTALQNQDPYFNSWTALREDTLFPNAPGNFSYLRSHGKCSAIDSLKVLLRLKPEIGQMTDSACLGESIRFDNPLPSNYQISWSGNGSSENIYESKQNETLFLRYSDGVCSDSILVQSHIHPLPVITNITLPKLCVNESLTLNYPSSDEVKWTVNGQSYAGNSIELPARENTYKYNLELRLKNLHACIKDSSFTLLKDSLPEYQIEEQYVGCNTPLDISIIGIADSILWEDNHMGWTFHADSTGTYPFELVRGACKVQDKIEVYIINQPPIELGPDTFLCNNESLTLRAPVAVQWSTGDVGKETTVTNQGWYSMFIEAQGCRQDDSIYIKTLSIPVLDLPDSEFCEGEGFELPQALQAYEITWLGAKPNADNLIKFPGLYRLKASSACGDSLYSFNLEEKNCRNSIYLPSAFTPDNDGINDLYAPVHEGFYKVRLRIFDRWGELIFDKVDENPSWDGSYHGEKVQVGVYSVMVDGYYRDAQGKEGELREIGQVTVVR